VTVPDSQPVPLRRARSGAVLGGVCAGLGRRMGVDPLLLRIGFVVASAAAGIGFALYAICWAVIPAEEGVAAGERRLGGAPGRRESWQVACGTGFLVLALLLLFRAWGIWLGDAIVWPLVLASGGGALIWRQSQEAAVVAPPAREQARPGAGGLPSGRAWRLRLARPSLGIVVLGAALVVGGALVFLWLNGALVPDRDVTLAVLVVVVALTLILAPWWLRLGRGLTEERAERIRTQERAELAAHLHDSVLQTLALMQKRAGDPREVAALARRQERELRAWLNGADRRARGASLAAALEEAVAEIEDAHGVPVDVVAVGDRPLDVRSRALVAAAREAVLNAVKFAPDAAISVYAEVRGDHAEVFVRDRGPGFELDAVPADRRGLRESVLGRMERHGGSAAVHTRPGEGTEIELVMDGE
jgi:signal transduction histidine kinase/phage shock protein PspC (stress-responsive transcriptional regulator)